jgi:TonB family protein
MKKTLTLLIVFIAVCTYRAKAQNTGRADSVYSMADVIPEFPGGERQFSSFLVKNMRYPASCLKRGIKATVFVKMIIEKDGAVKYAYCVRSVDADIDNEAIRVLKLSPKWKPGTVGGKPVRVYYTVPISFTPTAIKQ